MYYINYGAPDVLLSFSHLLTELILECGDLFLEALDSLSVCPLAGLQSSLSLILIGSEPLRLHLCLSSMSSGQVNQSTGRTHYMVIIAKLGAKLFNNI